VLPRARSKPSTVTRDPLPARPGATPAEDLVIVRIDRASHRYDGQPALDDVSLEVHRGEFLTLLGPSGSGKTTLLRIIAGLEHPSAVARLELAGRDVRGVPANERNVCTVFQHFALFPHMSVGENVAYGLRVRGVGLEERKRRAAEALALVRLPDKAERRIHQLSGGERQRVALARALVTRPDVLLLDEPLGALDEKLRGEMQIELKELHERLGTTFVLVTHSQDEALTMSDRIVLMRQGRIEQTGTPQDLFDRPISRFAAEFMGVENILAGRVAGGGAEGRSVLVDLGGRRLAARPAPGVRVAPGDPVFLAIRAEHVRLVAPGTPGALAAQIKGAVYKGRSLDLVLATEIGPIRARVWDTSASPPGDEAGLLPPERFCGGRR
jgi:ABC-type Fe3+/spermidine/putrescine transport system ATPase subunit